MAEESAAFAAFAAFAADAADEEEVAAAAEAAARNAGIDTEAGGANRARARASLVCDNRAL